MSAVVRAVVCAALVHAPAAAFETRTPEGGTFVREVAFEHGTGGAKIRLVTDGAPASEMPRRLAIGERAIVLTLSSAGGRQASVETLGDDVVAGIDVIPRTKDRVAVRVRLTKPAAELGGKISVREADGRLAIVLGEAKAGAKDADVDADADADVDDTDAAAGVALAKMEPIGRPIAEIAVTSTGTKKTSTSTKKTSTGTDSASDSNAASTSDSDSASAPASASAPGTAAAASPKPAAGGLTGNAHDQPLQLARESEISAGPIAAGLLLAVAGLALWLRRRRGDGSVPTIRIIASYGLGPRQRLAVVEVAGETHLIGASDHGITLLRTIGEPAAPRAEPTNASFGHALAVAAPAHMPRFEPAVDQDAAGILRMRRSHAQADPSAMDDDELSQDLDAVLLRRAEAAGR